MQRILSLHLFIAILCFCGCGGKKMEPKELAFIERYQGAHASGDSTEMMKLHWLEGVRDEDQTLLRYAIAQELTYPIAAIQFADLEPDDTIDFTFEGQEWGPNLKPVKRVIVIFDTPERLHSSFLLGEKNHEYYFVNASMKENH